MAHGFYDVATLSVRLVSGRLTSPSRRFGEATQGSLNKTEYAILDFPMGAALRRNDLASHTFIQFRHPDVVDVTPHKPSPVLVNVMSAIVVRRDGSPPGSRAIWISMMV